MTTARHPVSRLATRVRRLFGGESGAGILLILIAVAAMILANSAAAGAYHALFHGTLPITPVAKLDTLHLWINDGLMAVFFFVIGLEIKREVIDGELARPAQRRLPVLAAIMGMVAPALVYVAVTAGEPGLGAGWAIPAATDIAFAIGILALLGKRVPPSLRLFLLTVAIVDDLLAVAIIAVFYTAGIALPWLGAAAAILAAMVAMNRMGVQRSLPYVIGALALWFTVLHSGVHATVAGVLAALCIPMKLDRRGDSLLLRMEHTLAPLSAYLVVPVFGFANAGVELPDLGGAGTAWTLPMAIALGLFAGKQVGIMGAIAIARITGYAALPAGASWRHLWGVSLLCGIGFTMSLFIGQLAFPGNPDLIEQAKLGVIIGSLAAGLLAFAVLRFGRAAPAAAPG